MSAPTLFDPEPTAATTAAGLRPYVIELPARLPLLNSNQRLNKYERADLTRRIRAAAEKAVEECPSLLDVRDAVRPAPVFQRAHILGVLHPSSNGRRDPANWYPSFKACVDGLVDAGLLDDDDHTRLVGPDMRLGQKAKGGRLVLIVRGLAQDENWPDLGVVTQ